MQKKKEISLKMKRLYTISVLWLHQCSLMERGFESTRRRTCLTASSSLSRRCCLLASLCWGSAEGDTTQIQFDDRFSWGLWQKHWVRQNRIWAETHFRDPDPDAHHLFLSLPVTRIWRELIYWQDKFFVGLNLEMNFTCHTIHVSWHQRCTISRTTVECYC